MRALARAVGLCGCVVSFVLSATTWSGRPNPPAGRQSHSSSLAPAVWPLLLFDNLPEPPVTSVVRAVTPPLVLFWNLFCQLPTTAWHLLIVVTVICHSTWLSPGHWLNYSMFFKLPGIVGA